MIGWTTCPKCHRRIGIAALGRDLPAHRSGLGVPCVSSTRPPRPHYRLGTPVAPQRSVDEQMAAAIAWARDEPPPRAPVDPLLYTRGDASDQAKIDWEALNRVFKERSAGVV